MAFSSRRRVDSQVVFVVVVVAGWKCSSVQHDKSPPQQQK